MDKAKCFEKNFKRWSFFWPEQVKELKNVTPQKVFHCTTGPDELNLRKEVNGSEKYFHSEEGALEEAKKWFASLDLGNATILYVYGLELGYAYEAIKEWLEENKNRYLIFIEEDPEVLIRFFETDRASNILDDWRVRISLCNTPRSEERNLNKLVSDFPFQKFHVAATPYFEKTHPNEIEQKKATLYYLDKMKASMVGEFLQGGKTFYENFYSNLFQLPKSYLMTPLLGQFKGIPAIICGAGPSLDKNCDVLKTLEDRALIFGGGTSMNALNAKDIEPHFGAGIDPNLIQYTRLVANTAFNVPYIYRSRMNHHALDMIHGSKVYAPGAGGHNIADWVDKQLNLENADVHEGFNVVTLCMSIAHLLGCNPIIFVGLDLAYEGENSYASGIDSHALHVRRKDFRTKGAEDELLVKNDINGNPVLTQWRWVAESTWYFQFNMLHPDTILINATEGGIGLPGIDHKSLKEVADTFCKSRFDVSGLIHKELQSSDMPSFVTNNKIMNIVTEVEKSLKKCSKYCKQIILKYLKASNEAKEGKEESPIHETTEIKELQEKLENEIAYKNMLLTFSGKFDEIYRTYFLELEHDTTKSEAEVKEHKIKLEAGRYDFLRETCHTSLKVIQNVLTSHQTRLQFTQADVEQDISAPDAENEQQLYQYIDNRFVINDPHLGLSINEEFQPDHIKERHDADGQLIAKAHYRENELHGPSRFWSKEGNLISETWYYDGKKVGQVRRWYIDGTLERTLYYKKGLLHGKQLYYYQNAKIKSLVSYNEGRLDGKTVLFYENGRKKRELEFRQGKRDGEENMWSPYGMQQIAVQYKNGKPIGVAREWHKNGSRSRELVYDDNSNLQSLRVWNEDGMSLKEEEAPDSDYFDKVTLKTGLLTESLGEVHKRFGTMAEIVSQESFEGGIDISDDLADLEKEFQNLQELNKEVLKESGILKHSGDEALWKTPSSQKEISDQVEEATEKLTDELGGVQDALKNIIGALIRNSDKKDKNK